MKDINYKKLAIDHGMSASQFRDSIFNMAAELATEEMKKISKSKLNCTWHYDPKMVMTLEIKEGK